MTLKYDFILKIKNQIDRPTYNKLFLFGNNGVDATTGTDDAKLAAITEVVVNGGDVDAAMDTYVATVGSIVDQCLSELNAAE